MHQKVQKNTRRIILGYISHYLGRYARAVCCYCALLCKKGKSMNRNVTKCYKRWWWWASLFCKFGVYNQPGFVIDKFERRVFCHNNSAGQEATNYDRRGQNDNKIGHYRRVNCKLSGSLKFAVLAALELWRTTPAARLADRRPRWYVDSNEQPPNDGHLSPNWN